MTLGPPTSTFTPAPTPVPTITPSDAPRQLSGLVLWLDASQITGLNDFARVSRWDDKSGGGKNAQQSVASRRPKYRLNFINGLPVVRFDGTDDVLSIAQTVVAGAQNRTVFIVAKPDVVGNRPMVDLGGGTPTGARFALTPEYGVRARGGRRLWQAAATTVPQLSVFILSGTHVSDVAAWVNGSPMSASFTKDVAINTSGSAAVGSYATGAVTGQFFDGYIAEIIVYNRALSTQERMTIETYLATKYGLTLTP